MITNDYLLIGRADRLQTIDMEHVINMQHYGVIARMRRLLAMHMLINAQIVEDRRIWCFSSYIIIPYLKRQMNCSSLN